MTERNTPTIEQMAKSMAELNDFIVKNPGDEDDLGYLLARRQLDEKWRQLREVYKNSKPKNDPDLS
jgi:hypothetical protein